ncbi:hypothetical protein DASC09_013960 [Saccharomycopsis crataegensis]|uniref:5-hydroxyisourate hydrolase n=1 Tax=Saccharomycopsis crataegensis TaxID=43959 RepID=A0AAV5QH89_9ASCO|nr:hypothetical protein DASC09_013960 [Saccharomycopsis crataegensis]
MPPITCHILDTTKGKPASNVTCALYQLSANPEYLTNDSIDQEVIAVPNDDFKGEIPFAVARTNDDGRIPQWIINGKSNKLEALGIDSKSLEWHTLKPGVYKIRFHTKQYFNANRDELLTRTFFPFVDIHFVVNNPPDKHYHIPLLLSNHSYTTYRGS